MEKIELKDRNETINGACYTEDENCTCITCGACILCIIFAPTVVVFLTSLLAMYLTENKT